MERAWLAGILEGEGWFSVGDDHRVHIGLSMTDEDVVQRVAKLINVVHISRRVRNSKHKPIFTIYLYGKKALSLMALLLPLMGKRRSKKISEIIEYFRLRNERIKLENKAKRKFSEENVKEIRKLVATVPMTVLAKMYHVTPPAIRDLVLRKTYKEVA